LEKKKFNNLENIRNVNFIKMKEKLENKWVIILDELSTIDANLFVLLDERCRDVTGKMHLPFGGISIIAFGDAFQLP
jgi:hypothetical protein